MSKIEFDATKVYRSAAAIRAEESARIYEKYAEALKPDGIAKMDAETKSAIEDLLKTVRKGPLPTPPSPKPVPYDDFAAARDREYIEKVTRERDAARYREVERERAYERDRALARERAEAARLEEARIRKETEAQRERFAELSNPPRFHHREALRNEVAALSVNSAKACVVLRCIQCKELVDQLEREVPQTKRAWNGLDMVWEFHPSAMSQVRGILGLYFKDIQVVGVPKAIPATKFDQLFAKLTKDDKNKIYRLLAGTYHPDKGGSAEVMTLINLVFKEK